LLKQLIINFLITFFTPYCVACSIAPVLANVPENQQKVFKRVISENHDRARKAGKVERLDKLYRDSDHIYIGKVEYLLLGKERKRYTDPPTKSWVYINISEGWKKGKVRHFGIAYDPPMNISCSPSVFYTLKQDQTYLFYESLGEIISATSMHRGVVIKHSRKNEINPMYLTNTQYLGTSDWYYARTSDIKYNTPNNRIEL
jgi:hypothetical protein